MSALSGYSTYVYNVASSTLDVTGDFTLLGSFSYLYNGELSGDTATLAVGGNFSLDANTYFIDYGTMSLSGAFDPGADPYTNNIVYGTFNANPGSSVVTNITPFEIQQGGNLNVAKGATFAVSTGGALVVDSGGSATVQGVLDLFGTLDASSGSVMGVDSAGQLLLENSAQVGFAGTLLVWNDPADIDYGTPLGDALNAAAMTMADGTFVTLPGTFTYSPAPDTVLSGGRAQPHLSVAFTPK